nr:hypothetical protein [Helicobacter pylori]
MLRNVFRKFYSLKKLSLTTNLFGLIVKNAFSVLDFYSLFFILYSLFFILYSLFFILYSLFFILPLVVFFIAFVFNFLVWGVVGFAFRFLEPI